MLMVLKHVGSPVFLTGLSSAHTFSTGSLLKSSYSQSALQIRRANTILHTETVTNKLVPST
jgi:hypothetical protein